MGRLTQLLPSSPCAKTVPGVWPPPARIEARPRQLPARRPGKRPALVRPPGDRIPQPTSRKGLDKSAYIEAGSAASCKPALSALILSCPWNPSKEADTERLSLAWRGDS